MKKILITLCLFVFANYFLIAQVTQIGNEINGSENNLQAGASLSFNNTGDVLAIGYLYTNPFFEDLGMGRVFEFQNGEWIQKGSDIGDQYPDDKGFHISLNVDGSVLAMSTGSYSGGNSVVTIYEFVNDDWQLMGNPIDIDEGTAKLNDLGNTVIVSNSISNELKVYEFLNNDWQLKGDVIISNGVFWGLPVDIDSTGNIIAALNFNGGLSHSINIYIYENNQWNQIGEIEAEPFYQFKLNFDLNKHGDAFVINTYKEDVNEVLFIETKVYNYINNVWTQVGTNIINNPTEEFFYIEGQATISADGNIIAIGNPIGNGSVMLYKSINNEWIQLDNGIQGNGGEFGRALSFNDDATLLSVGAPKFSDIGNLFGQVKVYEIDYELFDVKDNSLLSTITLFPNPTHDYFIINSQNEILINNINIYDVSGRLLLSKNNPSNQINISSLTDGLLFVQLETEKGIKVEKIIKQ
ncbi:MAG: T9SS type A sorting domain-containing protein [Flavobacteriaceae bacterium]|nr:T9SS type A sorting domain-containing protein [Flavobacteriaceae bacterium]